MNKQTDKILICDDNEKNLYTYSKILSAPDKEIITATSGEEALKLLLKQDVSLILMDVQMPGMDGFETAQLILARKQTQDIPIIFISAIYKQENFISKGFALGAVDYLTKPIDAFLLKNKVEVFLKIHRQKQALKNKQIEISQINNSLEKKVEERTDKIKKMQAQIIQTSKLASIGTLAAGIAHELNNPLTIVMGYSKINCHATNNLQKIVDGSIKINRAAFRMKNIIDHLRTFARQSKQEDWQQININEVIENSLIFTQNGLKSENIAIELSLNQDIPYVWGDKTQLESVFQNLIANSKDAFQEITIDHQKSIQISTFLISEEKIGVTYQDNAFGMSKKTQEQIFDPFYTTKEVGKGTGLGMSIAHGIVESHRGQIALESIEGKGSKFSLSFPVYSFNQDYEENPDSKDKLIATECIPPLDNKHQLLIIDDEAEVSEVVAEYVKEGFKPYVSNDSSLALNMIEKKSFDIILTDMRMPGPSGMDILTQAQKYQPQTPVVIISGDNENADDIKDALSSGAKGILRKPLETPDKTIQFLRGFLHS